MPAKKTKSVKKAVAPKKTSAKPKARRVSSAKAVRQESFTIVKETQPFISYKFTQQTALWLVLVGYVLFLSLWILKLQIDTLDIINQIHAL